MCWLYNLSYFISIFFLFYNHNYVAPCQLRKLDFVKLDIMETRFHVYKDVISKDIHSSSSIVTFLVHSENSDSGCFLQRFLTVVLYLLLILYHPNIVADIYLVTFSTIPFSNANSTPVSHFICRPQLLQFVLLSQVLSNYVPAYTVHKKQQDSDHTVRKLCPRNSL